METQYLLDTNICIYIRQKRPETLLRRFEKLRPGEAAISVITHGELLYGAEKSVHRYRALERLQELVVLLPALAFDSARVKRTGVDDAAVREEHAQGNDMVDSLAVNDGMRAGGIVGDHAADGGAVGRRYVRGEVQSVRPYGGVEVVENAARLDADPALARIDREI